MAQWISPDLGLVVIRSGFENLIDNIYATITGGSGKWFDDFPIIGLPAGDKQRGIRCSQAAVNLASVINANMPSLEAGTTDGWGTPTGCTLSNSGDYSHHGFKSLKATCTIAGGIKFIGVLTNVTIPGFTYTASMMFRGVPGIEYYLRFWDNVTGYQSGTAIVANGDWQFMTITATFNATSTTRYIYPTVAAGLNVGDVSYFDTFMLNQNGVPLPFCEKEALATNVSVPTPFAAGQAWSAVFMFWTPTAGNDGVARTIFDCVGTGAAQNRVLLQKDAANNLNFNVWDNASAVKQCVEAVNATDWPAGTLKVVAVSRDAAGVMNAALGGVVFGTLNAGAGTGLEAAVGATSHLGSTTTPGDYLNGSEDAFILPGYAFTAEECVAYSSLKTWLSPARDGFMCNRASRTGLPINPVPGVDYLAR